MTTGLQAGPPERRRLAWRLRLATIALGVRQGFVALLTALVLVGAGLVAYAVLSGSWTITPILSGSMQPGFAVGGVVVAERMPTSALAVGDVIIFQDPNRPSERVVHRITQLTAGPAGEPLLQTKGDANNAKDPWTISLKGTSVYIAQFTLPLLGYPAISTNRGVDLIIGGAVLLLVALSTLISRERRTAAERPKLGPDAPGALTAVAVPEDRIPA